MSATRLNPQPKVYVTTATITRTAGSIVQASATIPSYPDYTPVIANARSGGVTVTVAGGTYISGNTVSCSVYATSSGQSVVTFTVLYLPD